jgi:hypothetical protein
LPKLSASFPVAPKLQRLPVRVITEAMSEYLARLKVRAGKLVPHRRHWQSLVKLWRRSCIWQVPLAD